ncbi:MAG: hypothetical protein K1X28_03660 [Parachlamydiales bacterium]|nr:hypothetical protein [Parachlamydiales bacterium]
MLRAYALRPGAQQASSHLEKACAPQGAVQSTAPTPETGSCLRYVFSL